MFLTLWFRDHQWSASAPSWSAMTVSKLFVFFNGTFKKKKKEKIVPGLTNVSMNHPPPRKKIVKHYLIHKPPGKIIMYWWLQSGTVKRKVTEEEKTSNTGEEKVLPGSGSASASDV